MPRPAAPTAGACQHGKTPWFSAFLQGTDLLTHFPLSPIVNVTAVRTLPLFNKSNRE
jgi:hypothetical protein